MAGFDEWGDKLIDGENYLGRDVYDNGKLSPIGFIHWPERKEAEKRRVRKPPTSRPRNPQRRNPPTTPRGKRY